MNKKDENRERFKSDLRKDNCWVGGPDGGSTNQIPSTFKQQKTEKILVINIQNFRPKVIRHLKVILNKINATTNQKKFIFLKSQEILAKFISRIENNGFIIHKNKNPKAIAAAIIYSVIASNEELTDISFKNLAKIAGIGKSTIGKTYRQYFRDYHPRIKFPFYAYSFENINKVLSLYFLNFIKKDSNITTAELLSDLKKSVKEGRFSEQFNKQDINLLEMMLADYQAIFDKYFSDLIEVVKLLTFSSKNHRLIKATIVIYPLVKYLEEKGINLLQKTETFYKYIREIFDFLGDIHKKFFPERLSRAFEEKMTEQEYKEYYYRYRQIVGYRLKIFLIKNIYNGRFFRDGNCTCPECKKEGFLINTDLSRLNALEFHHELGNKIEIYSAVMLYEIFTRNQGNPNVLNDIISQMESEKVKLLCRCHHKIVNDYYFQYFNYFITWDKIFSLSSEEIHILIRIIVDNFRLTMNLSKTRKKLIRQRIKNRLKKRYIIEQLCGVICPICGEFNTKNHIRSFDFCHQNPDKKKVQASSLFDTYSCSEIVEILINEVGSYICTNCHTVFDMEYFDIIDDIYDDKEIAKKSKQDYFNVKEKFTPITKSEVKKVKDPLKKKFKIRGNYSKTLIAIYELSRNGIIATNKTISNYRRKDYSGIKSFFLRRREFLNKYVDFDFGKPTKYSLNNRGIQLVSLIYFFRDYYNSLEFDECKNCKFKMAKNCSANQPNQCPLIKKGGYLPFQL